MTPFEKKKMNLIGNNLLNVGLCPINIGILGDEGKKNSGLNGEFWDYYGEIG